MMLVEAEICSRQDLTLVPGCLVRMLVASRRYAPLLADFDGSSFPARSTMDALHRGDDVYELGSTGAGAISSERDKGGQGQRIEHGSVCSCGSLSTTHSDAAETATTSLEPESFGQSELGGEKRETRRRHRRDRNARATENMHFEGHLLRRVCAVNGKLSHDERSQDDRAVEILLENSGEDQLVRLRRNPEIMSILVRLKTLSTSLADPAMSGASPGSPTNVAGGGPTWRTRGVLRFAQQEYLRLFEELLGELLKTQREKSTVRFFRRRFIVKTEVAIAVCILQACAMGFCCWTTVVEPGRNLTCVLSSANRQHRPKRVVARANA